jgi:ankyrin repeat protein
VAQPPHRQARALVELLLDAGADPNDSQALYNTHFLPDTDWLQLFLDRGLTAARAINWNDRSQERILDYLLGQAALQGFTKRVALLLHHGADPSGRNHYNRRTHLENALLNGHLDIAELLKRRGASTPHLTGEEQFRAACLAGDEAEARRLLAAHPAAKNDPARWPPPPSTAT